MKWFQCVLGGARVAKAPKMSFGRPYRPVTLMTVPPAWFAHSCALLGDNGYLYGIMSVFCWITCVSAIDSPLGGHIPSRPFTLQNNHTQLSATNRDVLYHSRQFSFKTSPCNAAL